MAPAPASPAGLPPGELDAALAEGLRIWRQQRVDIHGVNKGACASCHSADGIELALWSFQDADIVRRAHIDGVALDEQGKLVRYFAALRQRYAVSKPRDVATDRPFQPGGSWFTGSSNARDAQFATQSLAAELPVLMGPPIETLSQAQAALAEIRASNPRRLKVGIEMPAISLDCARGSAECSLNDWMADLPRFPKPESEAAWFALNDRYIANPTDAALRELLIAVDSMTTPWLNPGETGRGAAGTLGSEKFKSMQILQHLLRREQLGLFKPGEDLNPIVAINGPGLERSNFPFVVGDIAFEKTDRILRRADQLPIFVRESLGETAARPLSDADVSRQKVALRTPWWWAGFMFDPALTSGTGTEYFVGLLANPEAETEGLAFHQLYAAMRSAVEPEYRARRGTDFSALRLPEGRVDIGREADTAMLFDTAEARQRYRLASVNWLRMHLLLLQDQLRRHGRDALSGPHLEPTGFVCEQRANEGLPGSVLAAASLDGASAAFLFGLYNEVRSRAGCPSRLLPSSYIAGQGTGLQVVWFASLDPNSGRAGARLGQRVEPMLALHRQEFDRGYYRDHMKAIGATAASATRSSGFLLAPLTGNYVFGERSAQQARLWVDGKLVFDSSQSSADQFGHRVNPGSSLRLQAGQRVSIVFERYNAAESGIALGWAVPEASLPMSPIPSSQLFPAQ